MSMLVLWTLVVTIAGLSSATTPTPVFLNKYLQPDKIDRESFLKPPAGTNLCARQCIPNDPPKICYYQWKAENYATVNSACGKCPLNITECDNSQCIPTDGYERGVIAINRMIPGPSIEVCLGDRIIVDLTNAMTGRSAAIHWHGVFQQGSQFMDGVPMLTQCSIQEGNTFRYDFVANNEGTHYWHSLDGLQVLDGIQGNLVVRVPEEYEANYGLYDYDLPEHEIFISDWLHIDADQLFPGLLNPNVGQEASSFLINGRGRTLLGTQSTVTPYAMFKVESDTRYRMRVIGALGTFCPVELSIQGHNMLIIATDGSPIAPTRVDSLILYSGERYDFVLTATNTIGPYWIHVKGLSECKNQRTYQLGVLQYENPPDASGAATTLALPYDPGYDGFPVEDARVMNPESGTCADGSNGVCLSQLVNMYPIPDTILSQLADLSFMVTFGFETFNETNLFTPKKYERYMVNPKKKAISSIMNNISFVAPPVPPLTQGNELKASSLCPIGNDGTPICPGCDSYCECTNVLPISYGAVVQLLVVDISPRPDLSHPFHMHGYNFYVMEVGQLGPGKAKEDIYADMVKNVHKTSSAPILKDTLTIPTNGYAIIKFEALNPGFWFFHCNFMFNIASGMGIVLQVGEQGDWPATPANFPKCGNYMPQVYN